MDMRKTRRDQTIMKNNVFFFNRYLECGRKSIIRRSMFACWNVRSSYPLHAMDDQRAFAGLVAIAVGRQSTVFQRFDGRVGQIVSADAILVAYRRQSVSKTINKPPQELPETVAHHSAAPDS